MTFKLTKLKKSRTLSELDRILEGACIEAFPYFQHFGTGEYIDFGDFTGGAYVDRYSLYKTLKVTCVYGASNSLPMKIKAIERAIEAVKSVEEAPPKSKKK